MPRRNNKNKSKNAPIPMPRKSVVVSISTGKKRRRNRRGRQPALASRPTTHVNYKTIHDVEKGLSKMSLGRTSGTSNASAGKTWANCRLNPWGAKISAVMPRVPDGSSSNGYSYDVYSFCDVVITGTQSIAFTTLPFLPMTAALFSQSGGVLAVSGPSTSLTGAPTAPPGAGFYNMPATSVPAGTILPVCYSKFPVNDITGVGAAGYGAPKARIISQAWRLVYTGTAANCQGVITVNPVALNLDGSHDKMLGTITWVNAAGIPGASLLTTVAPQSVLGAPALFNNSPNKESVQMRPETSPCGLARRSAGSTTWEYKDIHDQAKILVLPPVNPTDTYNSGNLQAAFAANFGSAAPGQATTVLGLVDFYDDQWDTTTISLTNVTGSFRFEVMTCYEFVPQQSTVLYEVSTASPPLDVSTLKGVETAARTMLARPSNSIIVSPR